MSLHVTIRIVFGEEVLKLRFGYAVFISLMFLLLLPRGAYKVEFFSFFEE
jgi:hypothetical protein